MPSTEKACDKNLLNEQMSKGRKLLTTVSFKSNKVGAVAGVAQWIECWPVNQSIAGSIPSQGAGLGCRPGPQ